MTNLGALASLPAAGRLVANKALAAKKNNNFEC